MPRGRRANLRDPGVTLRGFRDARQQNFHACARLTFIFKTRRYGAFARLTTGLREAFGKTSEAGFRAIQFGHLDVQNEVSTAWYALPAGAPLR